MSSLPLTCAVVVLLSSLLYMSAAPRSTKSLEAMHPSDLPLADLAIICELEDELNRVGHFTRIFPTTETRYYNQFFENPNKYAPAFWDAPL
jgi:hypothetical protein